MMDWKKSRERTPELLLVIGLMVVVLGFVDLLKMSGWQLVVAGFIITSIGTYYILNKIKEKEKKKR